MKKRCIYDPSVFWNIERNWFRSMHRLTQATYLRYIFEVIEEYRERKNFSFYFNRNIIPDQAYFFLFGLKNREAMKLLFGASSTCINCLDDYTLEILFFFRDREFSVDEVLEKRHRKVGERLRELCCHRSVEEGRLLVLDAYKEFFGDKHLYLLFAHGSSLVDKGIVERSGFDVFGRHFDGMNTEKLGWKKRSYEGLVPGIPVLKVGAKEIFVRRMMGIFYGEAWYSNFSITPTETILEGIGREEIPPLPEESEKARIKPEKEYDLYEKGEIIYGEGARYLRILPPGIYINLKEAEEIIRKERWKNGREEAASDDKTCI
ncbi:MAG: hypothetical protein ACXQS7_03875 [Candidatus Syntropharchaeia archaeon]